MITDKELKDYMQFKDPHQTEKDYLQDLLLSLTYSDSEYEFVFKGGTALSKFYASGRFSEDLDFTIKGSNNKFFDYFGQFIGNIAKKMPYDTTILNKHSENKFHTISCTLGIKGPRYNDKANTIQHISFEINTTAVLIYEPEKFKRTPIYSDAPEYVALVMKREEIFAEKVRAIMSKRRKHRERDIYDLAFLIRKGTIINKGAIRKKLMESNIEPSFKSLTESIGNIENNWKDLSPLVKMPLESYEDAKNTIIKNEELKNALNSK